MVRPRKGRIRRWSLSLIPEIDDLLEEEAKKRGVTKTDLVESIILDWAYRKGYNKIEHFNFRDLSITLVDYLLNAVVNLVYVEPEQRLYCEYCKAYDCGHIWAALRDEKIIKGMKERGWVIAEKPA